MKLSEERLEFVNSAYNMILDAAGYDDEKVNSKRKTSDVNKMRIIVACILYDFKLSMYEIAIVIKRNRASIYNMIKNRSLYMDEIIKIERKIWPENGEKEEQRTC